MKTTDQLLGELYEIISYRSLKLAYKVLHEHYPKRRVFARCSNEELAILIPLVKREYELSSVSN